MTAPIIHCNIVQHSPEWYAIKAGKWSASNAATIMGGLDTSGLASLVKDIAWERVYGATDAGFQSAAMQRGNELEADARRWYEVERGASIETFGFVTHATVPNVGWSPDGLRADNQRFAIEVKCPLHKAWMEVKRTGRVPAEYRWQTKWGLWVGQLDGEDFVAYHPVPGGLVIACEVTDSEKEQMEERVHLLEGRVAAWIETLGNQRNSIEPKTSALSAIDDPEAVF